MVKPQCILLNKGLDDLPFGTTRDDISRVFGPADEVDELDLGDEISIAWHYWNFGLSLNFDESKDFTLTTLEVASPEVTLFDEKFIGKSRGYIKSLLESKNVGPSKDEVYNGLVYPEVSLSFWFNGGECAEIQWGIVEEDNTIL